MVKFKEILKSVHLPWWHTYVYGCIIMQPTTHLHLTYTDTDKYNNTNVAIPTIQHTGTPVYRYPQYNIPVTTNM
jgi:hypothetical protein